MSYSIRLVAAALGVSVLMAVIGWMVLRPSAAAGGVPAGAAGGGPAGSVFAVDAEGRLLVDQRTRLALAALVALNTAPQIAARIDAEVRRLPPEAGAAARDLARRYRAYDEVAQERLLASLTSQAGHDRLAELSALSALRISYFGAELANRMFGDEEALSRRLFEQGRDGHTRPAGEGAPAGLLHR